MAPRDWNPAGVAAEELAERALAAFDDDALDTHLRPEGHRCPKCDEPMILRTGAFDPFWGRPRNLRPDPLTRRRRIG